MTDAIVIAENMQIVSGENELASSIYQLEQSIESVARQAVNDIIGDDEYTETEIEAMVVGKKMELTNVLDLAAILFRGKFIGDIESGNLVMYHPGQYRNLEEMAEDNGVSKTELSKSINLVQIIFPRLLELGYDIPTVWANIGKSNLGEMVPVLRQLITGEESSSERVRNAVGNMLNDVAASAQVANEELTEEEITNRAIQAIVRDGQELSFRELRAQINGNEETPEPEDGQTATPDTTQAQPERSRLDFGFTGFRINDDEAIVMTIVTRQNLDSFEQRFGIPNPVVLPTDPAQRQAELAQIPQVRRLLDFMSGV